MPETGNNFEEGKESALGVASRIFSAILIIAFFAFSGIAFNSNRNRDRSAGEEYVDIENGFTITYPKGWRIEKANTSSIKAQNHTVISFTNPVADIADKYLGSASITVSFGYSEIPVDLEVYKNVVKSDMAHVLGNFNIEKEEKFSLSGLEGYLITAKDNDEKSGGLAFKSLLFITAEKKSNREFFIWATAFESTWPKYEKLFENCIKSFKIPQ